MNEVSLSGILKGECTTIERNNRQEDGVEFTLVTKNDWKGNSTFEEFFCLAYGNTAKFLRQHAESGKRVILRGQLIREKIDEDKYRTVISARHILGITNSSEGIDFTYVAVTGDATCDDIRHLSTGTMVANIRLENQRNYSKKDSKETFTFTTHLDVAVWGEQAAELATLGFFPAKKTPIIVEGILRPGSYTNREGQLVNKLDIWSTSVSIIGKQAEPVPAPVTTATPSVPQRDIDDSPF